MKILISEQITVWAQALGFDAVAFTKASLPETVSQELESFLADNRHGDMDWMATHAARRRAPEALWPEARTAIILGHNYGPDYNPLDKLAEKDRGLISCYALGQDYHDVIKKKLKQLAGQIAAFYGTEVKVFVDTAPLMEKPLAAQSGLGWQGKHTCIVSRKFGSWLFLGEILTSLEVPTDSPEKDHCGNCTRCLDICPTGAFDGARHIDARKCISYLTIEHKGPIPHIYRKAIGNRIYGCDDCLAICPWNKFAQKSQENAYFAREHLPTPELLALLALDDNGFREFFARSPIKRIKRDRFLRNVLIAAGNSGNRSLIPRIQLLITDFSPLVRGAAVWAVAQLQNHEETLALAEQFMPNEQDDDVKQEWEMAIWQK